jgi:hypothetical protein
VKASLRTREPHEAKQRHAAALSHLGRCGIRCAAGRATCPSAQNVGRRPRELENEGVIEVRYEKNHAIARHEVVIENDLSRCS